MRLRLALSLLYSVTYWSCSTMVTGPVDQAGLRVVVHLSSANGTPERPVTLSATATNMLGEPVYHTVPCAGTTIAFKVRGPDGAAVLLDDPRIVPACPDTCCEPLAPQATLDSDLDFDGTLFTAKGATYSAPFGTYTVVATFTAGTEPHGGKQLNATRQASFRWTGGLGPGVSPPRTRVASLRGVE